MKVRMAIAAALLLIVIAAVLVLIAPRSSTKVPVGKAPTPAPAIPSLPAPSLTVSPIAPLTPAPSTPVLNTPAPTSVAPPAPSPTPDPAGGLRTVTVISGDTIGKISSKTGVPWATICRINSSILDATAHQYGFPSTPDCHWIFSGETLVLPKS